MEGKSLIFSEGEPIYLDYNGTTPISPEVATAIWPYITKHFGNLSSSHYYGKQAHLAVTKARENVANLLECDPKQIIFTSGSTESINHILRAMCARQFRNSKGKRNHIITSKIEHPAVVQCCKFLLVHGFNVTWLDCNEYGMIEPSALQQALTPKTIMVSIMHSNNEVGTINPISKLVEITRDYSKQIGQRIYFMSDTTQSIGKVPILPKTLLNDIDFITIGGHKLYAPKGIGAIYVKNEIVSNGLLDALIQGASQEFGIRPGTENVPYCVALGVAATQAKKNLKYIGTWQYLRDLLFKEIINNLDSKYHSRVRLNGHLYQRLPNTLSICFRYLRASDILDIIKPNIACSAGAACHDATNVTLSAVLQAMKVPKEFGMGTLRLSVGKYTTEEEVKRAAKIVATAVTTLYQNLNTPSKL